MEYNFKSVESKWQKKWNNDESLVFNVKNSTNKQYCLTMFSYPSGDKLHIGHWYNYGPADTFARFLKLNGHNVFQPQGFDAFGLPAENYAIKHGIHPEVSTMSNIKTMKSQLSSIGAMYNWESEVVTCKNDYYLITHTIYTGCTILSGSKPSQTLLRSSQFCELSPALAAPIPMI